MSHIIFHRNLYAFLKLVDHPQAMPPDPYLGNFLICFVQDPFVKLSRGSFLILKLFCPLCNWSFFFFHDSPFPEQSSMDSGVDLIDGNGVRDPPAKLVLEGGFQGAQGVQFVRDKDWSPPSVRAVQKRRNTDVSFSLSISQPIPEKSKMWVTVSLEDAYEKTLVKEGLCLPQPHRKGLPASERKRQRVDRIVRQIKVSEDCKETIRYQIFDGSDKLEKLIFNNLALRLFLSTSETASPECIHLIRTSPFLMYSRRLKPLPCSLLLPSPFPSKPGASLTKEKLKQKKAEKSFRIVQARIPRYSPRTHTRAVKRAGSSHSSFDLPLIPSPNKTTSVLFTKSFGSLTFHSFSN